MYKELEIEIENRKRSEQYPLKAIEELPADMA